MTHTYATLEISAKAFDEIANKLNDAGYYTAFDDKGTQIDMEGIALVRKPSTRVDKVPREAFEFAWLRALGAPDIALRNVLDGNRMMESAWQDFLSTRDKPSEFDEKDPRATL